MNSQSLPDEAIAAIRHGQKIEAIKILRRNEGLDLRAAKERVESYIDANPDVAAAFRSARKESGCGMIFFIFVGFMIAISFIVSKFI